jgi:hypothetical protein
VEKNTFCIKNHAKTCTILRGWNQCILKISYHALTMTKWIKWKLHFQGSKWPTKWFLGFDNCPLPSLVWKHMVMVMIDMHIILMGCGLMIPISQLGPYCAYFKIWKKIPICEWKIFLEHTPQNMICLTRHKQFIISIGVPCVKFR